MRIMLASVLLLLAVVLRLVKGPLVQGPEGAVLGMVRPDGLILLGIAALLPPGTRHPVHPTTLLGSVGLGVANLVLDGTTTRRPGSTSGASWTMAMRPDYIYAREHAGTLLRPRRRHDANRPAGYRGGWLPTGLSVLGCAVVAGALGWLVWWGVQGWAGGTVVGWTSLTVEHSPDGGDVYWAVVQTQDDPRRPERRLQMTQEAGEALRAMIEAQRSSASAGTSVRSMLRPGVTFELRPDPSPSGQVYSRLTYGGWGACVSRVESVAPPNDASTWMRQGVWRAPR